jgi:glutathione synthase/RimK-type ligase-like ATP-grasp enzyme
MCNSSCIQRVLVITVITSERAPVVIKPIIDEHGHPVYARKSQELINKYKAICEKNPFSENYLPMIQEYIVADSTHSAR